MLYSALCRVLCRVLCSVLCMNVIKNSFWIDQYTRFVVIDFSVLNLNSNIASSIRIRFDFHRSAPYWHASSFHFFYILAGNYFYYIAIVAVFFTLINAYNIWKELLLVYKLGPSSYFDELSSYVEISKVLLSTILCYVYFRKSYLKYSLLHEIKYSYLSRGRHGFIDFFEMAVMDYVFTVTAGFLVFLCIFQLFHMLSKIRRLVVFMRLVLMAVKLFYMPVLSGMAFTFLSNILFCSTNENFSGFGLSYLMVNQYFIKPRAIYRELTANHPYVGPLFYFMMGMMISLFLFNIFLAFLNEAYSSIHNQVSLERYKVREKSRLEYVYDFLGIKTRTKRDEHDDLQLVDRENDRNLLSFVKRLQAT
ncbi:hypothetical protein RRG08_036818 [Elysia crispata]|uniref:Polycystin cation channel PKD1/PKD2 domain-containing protein n=1 Tax=Elysia crispata TaxID=231223 RepID=A0AAE0Y805_9GAST|nr:hypothetical protein RRG08_036818 [Elysia crispata]